MSAEVALTASTFEVAWEHAKLGEMPIVLYVPPSGFLEIERAAVVRRAWEELESAGLARHGRLDESLAGMLELLSTPSRAVDARLALGRAGQPGTEVCGMAAARGGDGVLARLVDDTLTLRQIFGDALSREIVKLLPDEPAGPGRSVSLPREQLDPAARAAGSSLSWFAERLIRAGVPGDQARTLIRMIDGTKRRGQFGAAVREPDGRRRAAQRVVGVHDTPGGRYLMVDRAGTDGRVWTTVTPAAAHVLVEHVQAMLDALAAADHR